MTTPGPTEARLREIEAREAREERIYFPDGRKCQSETAWLVALVRRYRRALEGVAALASSSDIEQQAIWDTAREALNEG